MVSLIEDLEAREAAARVRVEELEAEIAELTSRLVGGREAWSRLRVTRETVTEVLAEQSGQEVAETAPLRELVAPQTQVEPEVRVVGAIMVPHWREGLTTDVLPDVYRHRGGDRGCVGADAGQADRAPDRTASGDRKDRGDAGETEMAGGTGLADRGPARPVRTRSSGAGRESANSQNDKGSSL